MIIPLARALRIHVQSMPPSKDPNVPLHPRAFRVLAQHGKTSMLSRQWHRSWKKPWKGFWVAGFTGKSSGNQLFYLMQVGQLAASQYKLWHSGYLPNRNAKSAALDIFGDVYEPLPGASGQQPFNPALYRSPVQGHVHLPTAWMKDIYYPKLPLSNQPKHLVGIPARSFLWSSPKYHYKCAQHPRFKFYQSLRDFFDHLM